MKFVTIGFYKIITESFNLFVSVLTEATTIWFIFISITCGIIRQFPKTYFIYKR